MHIIPGKFNINCPRALAVDLVTGARRKVTGLDIYRGNTALVNWSES